jgi:outer membrane receptor protein involved in Fe transport
MRSGSSLLLAACSLFALNPALAHGADYAAEPAQAVSAGDDIIVTAQKREQKVKDVPLTVSTISQDDLTRLGVSELGEMASYVPGLQIQKQSANNPGFVIRGITSDSGSAQAGSRVSVFYNGVDISRARGAWQDLFDMERIEVVKGPQATLFGTAAEVGAVSLISARPQPGFSGGINASYGNYNRTQVSGFLNAGNDTLAGRVAFSHKYRHGYTKNLQAGQDDLNGEDDWGGRASLRWTPSTKVTVDAIFTYDRQRDPGTGFTSLVYPTVTGSASPYGTHSFPARPTALLCWEPRSGLSRDVTMATSPRASIWAAGSPSPPSTASASSARMKCSMPMAAAPSTSNSPRMPRASSIATKAASTTTAKSGTPPSAGTPLSKTAISACPFPPRKAPIWPAPPSAASLRSNNCSAPMAWARGRDA